MGSTLVDVRICKDVPLNNTYEHTLFFATSEEQKAYFQDKTVAIFDNVRFIHKNGSMKLNGDVSRANEWSYLWFVDPENPNRPFRFYFITEVEAESDSVVVLHLELDVIQTYQHFWNTNPCFIEREHTATDVFGENTVDENLDVGELVSSHVQDIDLNDWCILLQCTKYFANNTGANSGDVGGEMYNDIYSGMVVYAVNARYFSILGKLIEQLAANGVIDGLVNMWMYPRALVQLSEGETWNPVADLDDFTPDTWKQILQYVDSCGRHDFSLAMPEQVDGYTPRNKKVLQYPFNMLYCTNNNGTSAVYHYERFGSPGDIHFTYFGTLSAEGVARAYPLNYKGVQHNYEEGLTLPGFPTCAWNCDTYKLWLAQNQNQRQTAFVSAGITAAGGAIATIGSAATGNILGAAGGVATMAHGITSIMDMVAQKKDMSIQPPQARGQHSGSLNMVAGFQTFTFMRKSVNAEYAKIIDSFFDLYGYASHRVKVPKYTNRPAWNYIKTRNACITGNIPVNDLVKINNIFNNGVTWWMNPARFCDYSQNNAPQS